MVLNLVGNFEKGAEVRVFENKVLRKIFVDKRETKLQENG